MVVYVELSDLTKAKEEIDKISEFLLNSLDFQILRLEKYIGYPSDDIAEETKLLESHEIKLLDSNQWDYYVYHGHIKSIPFVLTLKYNKTDPDFEFSTIHLSPLLPSNQINWNELLGTQYIDFQQNFHDLISTIDSVSKAYIGPEMDYGIELGKCWYFYYKYENELIDEIFSLLYNWANNEYDIKEWLKVEEDEIERMITIINVFKSNAFSGLYSTNEIIHDKRKIENLLTSGGSEGSFIRKFIDKLSTFKIAFAVPGSIAIGSLDGPNNKSVRASINAFADIILHGIIRGVDIEKIRKSVLEISNELLDKIFD